MSKKVLITGVLGQDGANMAEYLLGLPDIMVFGMMRRSATPNFENIKSIRDHERFRLVFADLTDEISIDRIVQSIRPDYFINFAANSFVACSWDMPLQVFDVNAVGVLRCLEALRKYAPDCRFYSAGSSEEFGDIDYSPQDMKHPKKPRSPYAASKVAAGSLVKVYRESYNMYAVHGILFNHEGTKRSEEFVTRKITKGVANIHKHIKARQWHTPIQLGNLDAKRDWSDSRDFVKGIWLMLNQSYPPDLLNYQDEEGKLWRGINSKVMNWKPKDYILASGESYSIRDFVVLAFGEIDIQGCWEGEGVNEKFLIPDTQPWLNPVLVEVNKEFFRPAEVEILMGDASEARKDLGWKPEVSFHQLVRDMVQHDISLTKK